MELSKVTLEIFTKLEQKWLETTRKTRILTIDGGGTTCIAAAASLARLEAQIVEKTGDPTARIADFFDLVAGTGVGAVLAAMIVADDGSGRPMYTARDAGEALKNPRMFKKKPARVFRPSSRLSSTSLERSLREIFTKPDGTRMTLRDTCKPILVPCFDLKSSAPFVFSRADALGSESFDFEMWKVCRATTATPGVFGGFLGMESVDGRTVCDAVDGGLVMNNPTAAAVTHVLNNKRDFPGAAGVEDLLVLSLGNGTRGSLAGAPGRGCSTTATVVGIAVDGVSETVDQMMGNAFCWNPADYVRIQSFGLGAKTEEVLKERGVESLPFGGKRLLTETNGDRIDGFVQRLVASGRSSLPPSPCKELAVKGLVNVR